MANCYSTIVSCERTGNVTSRLSRQFKTNYVKMIRNSFPNVNRANARRTLGSNKRACAIQRHSNSNIPRNGSISSTRRKIAIEHCSKRRGGRKEKQLSQDGRRCCVTVKNSGEMSSHSGGPCPGTGRKRGHQHHPRNQGTRGLTIQRQQEQFSSSVSYEPQTIEFVTERTQPLSENSTVKSDNKVQAVAAVIINVDSNKFSGNILQPTTEYIDDANKSLGALVNKDDDVVSTCDRLQVLNVHDDEENETETTEDEKINVKTTKNAANEKRKRHRSRSRPKGPRPAVEGGPGPQEDTQDDLETQELARLRCTSERTELVAERENRRKNRCADYPGLAFGRSIFSSDTMMKFSIIKNELHNIMNAQLKRVRRRAVHDMGYHNLTLPSFLIDI